MVTFKNNKWGELIRLYRHPGSFRAYRDYSANAAKNTMNGFILHLCAVSAIPSFLILWTGTDWTEALMRCIINAVSLYAGVWIVYGTVSYYLKESPEGTSKKAFLVPLLFTPVALYILPASLFYAAEGLVWRHLFFAAAIAYMVKTLKDGISSSPDIELSVKNNTLLLITITMILSPFIIQRILLLLFNLEM